MSRTPRPRLVVAVGISAVLVATLASCASTPADPASPTADAVTEGGIATVVLDNPVVCADPQQGTAFSGLLAAQHTVDQLTYQNPETGEIEPWLASSWEVNEDSTEFAFTIRDDVTFSDGTALTADVVERNIDEIVGLGSASIGSGLLTGLEDVSADGDIVTFVFSEPNAQFLQATSTTSLGILSESSYDITPEARCQGDYIGSGPFVLDTFTLDESITVTKRDGYDWAPASSAAQGEAHLDGIEFLIVPEAGVRTGLLASGQADAISGVFREDEATFDAEQYWLQARATPGFTNSLVVNGRSPILADADVREALQIAIDRDEVLATLASPLAKPAIGLLTSTAPFGGDFRDEFALDVDRSNELLDEAGWQTIGEDGIRVKDGQRLSLRVVHFAAQSPLIELVNQQLHAVGAELASQVLDPAQRDAVESAADFDLLQRNMTRADPDALRNQLGFEFSNYLYREAPGELDELLAAQAATTDVAARQQIVDEIQTLLLGDAVVWPLNELTQVYAGSTALQGVTLDGSSRLNLAGAWKEAGE